MILLANKQGILGTTSFGIADKASRRRNEVTTLFRTKSVGKLVTATAILQLVERGKLDLHKTIAYYIPGSGIPNADKISLHHLLTHQSGLISPWEGEGFEFRV